MRRRNNLHAMMYSGLTYGVGLAVGMLLARFLVNNGAVQWFTSLIDQLQLFLRLLFSIFLIIVFVGLSGGIGGAIGGWGLFRVSHLEDQRRVMWRSAASFFITHALLIIPFILITMLVGFANPDIDVRFSRLPSLILVYGLIYGAVVGLLLGWLLVGLRQTLGVFLASSAGFAIGGWLAGAALFLFAQISAPGLLLTALAIAVCMFIFGAAGGSALGLAMQYAHEARTIFPQTRSWHIMRNVALVLLALIFLSAFGKLINTLTIKPGQLAETLPLTTVGSHWQEEDPAQAVLNPGPLPQTLVDSNGRSVEVSCAGGQLDLAVDGGSPDLSAYPSCANDPAIAEDSEGNLHLVWYSDEATKVTGKIGAGDFLLESIEQDVGWSPPAIIARPAGMTQPAISALADGRLQLVWDNQDDQRLMTYTAYNCDDAPLTDLGQVLYDVARQEKFRPSSDPIPYCQNQYEQLMVTPNPTAPDSDAPQSSHGAFDRVAELVETAEYEVLFTTMQWDKPSDTRSPGDTLAEAVFNLYEKVKANPEAYPRGMTVRIMLGNVPDLAIFEPTNQITSMMQDMHDAGLREMVNEEIGWRLELANYAGAWPHAHSKFVVVDGKTAVAVGFNYSYLHLDKDHPSGLGLDMNDLGIQITGPLAQSVMAAYDDLWSGSDHYSCSRFPPLIPLFWFLWCGENPAVADHTPEVMRFYATDGDTNAFSLHHTMRYLESDEAIFGAINAAQESINLYEVNFSLDTVCVVITLLTGSCNIGELAPPYMQALADAAIERDVQIRVLAEATAMNGLENRMAFNWLRNELETYGKTDNVKFKFYNGKMHDKSALIDNELLIIGSQNFHWSAWGTPSLTEYNIATDDREAVADFSSEFEHQWQKGISWEDQILLEEEGLDK